MSMFPSTQVGLFFDRDDVALENFSKFFSKRSEEKREHAEKLIKYQNERGGRKRKLSVSRNQEGRWANGLEALQNALKLEKNVNQALLDLHGGGQTGMMLICAISWNCILSESTEVIKKLGDHISSLKKLGANQPGMGEYLFDKQPLG
ncbi:hypothetical protein GDO86_019979 [Hymenochirus boettgeri]|uniref:Ferritin n=1 Tax=Hymenochirus boettgeri TaxID=247094 RepID=A0A8T2IC90_9PIPI|nr:hypothetical protein GDO86_019979 [Hymenochirus boettgeri]